MPDGCTAMVMVIMKQPESRQSCICMHHSCEWGVGTGDVSLQIDYIQWPSGRSQSVGIHGLVPVL